MDRRRFVRASTCWSIALPIFAHAQQQREVWRIGYLGTTPPTTPEAARIWDVFQRALRERGYVDGENLVIERRFSGGRDERYQELATELVRLGVDLIITVSSPGNARRQGCDIGDPYCGAHITTRFGPSPSASPRG